jgi:hypothetical protein
VGHAIPLGDKTEVPVENADAELANPQPAQARQDLSAEPVAVGVHAQV